MEKRIEYQGIDLVYEVQGEGPALVFLHGYLESKEIWQHFTGLFADNYKVICIDLPGHGKSGILGECHDMDLMANAVDAVLMHEGVRESVMFGHSMGGYVLMEYVYNFREKLKGYCLFHSTCFADNEEKKNNRDREIGLVKCGKKNQIIHTNIPKGFADSNLEGMKTEIEHAKQIAMASPEEGVVALLRGMKNRKDHSEALRMINPPLLLIWGKKDNYIGEEAFRKLITIAPHASVIILQNSGHMGFLEETECVYSGITGFLESIV